MALLGCDVFSTDQVEVLPLLMRNVECNTSRITQMNPDTDSIGSITAAELSWGNDNHIRALDPPFDYIIGTDVAYAEHLLKPLLHTMLTLSGPKTTILVSRCLLQQDWLLHLTSSMSKLESYLTAENRSHY